MKVGEERGLEGAPSILIKNLQLGFAAVRPEDCKIWSFGVGDGAPYMTFVTEASSYLK